MIPFWTPGFVKEGDAWHVARVGGSDIILPTCTFSWALTLTAPKLLALFLFAMNGGSLYILAGARFVPVKLLGTCGINRCGSARNRAGARYNAGVWAWHVRAFERRSIHTSSGTSIPTAV